MEFYNAEMVPKVIKLFDGYSKYIDDKTMDANCSCTLIRANKTIIVDTMTAWDRENLINALHKCDVTEQEVDYVVCTHAHTDHTGNNNLFTNAEHIVGCNSVNKGTFYYDKDIKNNDYELCPFVKVSHTPGHTAEDVSVIVQIPDIEKSKLENKFIGKVYAIAGDLFEKEEDIENPQVWMDLGMPELKQVQCEMRKRIANLADYIIPGHGPMFEVTDSYREKLNNLKV